MAKINFTRVQEGKYPGEFIISEANGTRSRDAVTVAASQEWEPGQVLAVNADGDFVAWDGEGEAVAVAVAIYGIKTDTDKGSVAAITRDAEVAAHSLVVPDSADVADAAADLKAVGIIVR